MALMIFFFQLVRELAKDIHSDINPLTYVNNVHNSIVNFDVSCDEVKNIIRSLKILVLDTMNFPLLLGNFVWIAK